MSATDIERWVIENFEGFAYTDDPVDLGGATKFGITQRTLSYWRQRYADLGPATKQDVRDMTLELAIQVSHDIFMIETGYDVLSNHPKTQLILYDFSFHSGASTAIKALQRAMRGLTVAVDVDGKFGPRTRQAINLVIDDYLLSLRLLTEREEFMQAIMERDLTQRKYVLGWWKRTTRLQRKLAE